MTKIRFIVDETLVTLKQTIQDRQVSDVQVAYLIILAANDLKAKHIVKRSSGAFLKPFSEIPVFVSSVNQDGKIVKGRQFIYLPKSIFDFDGDRAIDYIAYTSDGGKNCPPRFTEVTFTRTTPKASHRLYMSSYEKPKPSTPYFYRMGDLVFFLGTEEINLTDVEAGLFTTIDPIDKIDIDSELDFPEELLKQLKISVLDMARFVLMVPNDRTNDGANEVVQKQVPTNKLVSVAPDNQQDDNGQ